MAGGGGGDGHGGVAALGASLQGHGAGHGGGAVHGLLVGGRLSLLEAITGLDAGGEGQESDGGELHFGGGVGEAFVLTNDAAAGISILVVSLRRGIAHL